MSHTFYGLDHIQLAAPPESEDAARRFFGEIMGLQEVEKTEELRKRGGVWFQCGLHQIHIGIQQDFVPAKKAHPAIHVGNVKALKDRMTSFGVAVKDDELLPGAERFYADDPFGNRLEFLEWKV